MVKCKGCGGKLELTQSACPACGAPVELGRLTGILGLVCRACDAYNEPDAKACVACGKPLGAAPAGEAPSAPPPAAAPAPPSPPASPPQAAAAKPGAPPPAPPAGPAGRPSRSGAPRPPASATRFVPSAQRAAPPPPPSRPPAAPPPPRAPSAPIPLVSSCPRCGAEAAGGRFCASCGAPLGARGTQVMAAPPVPGAAPEKPFRALEPGRARLVLEAGVGLAAGATFALAAERVAAGRTEGPVRFPDDPCLAPHHATFLFRDGGLHVRDEGAPGGVYLRLRGLSVPLRPGDHFAVGERLLRYAGPLPPPPTPPPDGTVRLGAPRPAAPAVVIEEWLEGARGGRVFVRGGPAVTIGRAGCAVSLGDDPHVSQAHAELLVDAAGAARLKDLGSTNGTYVKLPPRAERELHDGDCVRMGHEVLRVSAGEGTRGG